MPNAASTRGGGKKTDFAGRHERFDRASKTDFPLEFENDKSSFMSASASICS
jgi:hypothetical protein